MKREDNNKVRDWRPILPFFFFIPPIFAGCNLEAIYSRPGVSENRRIGMSNWRCNKLIRHSVNCSKNIVQWILSLCLTHRMVASTQNWEVPERCDRTWLVLMPKWWQVFCPQRVCVLILSVFRQDAVYPYLTSLPSERSFVLTLVALWTLSTHCTLVLLYE